MKTNHGICEWIIQTGLVSRVNWFNKKKIWFQTMINVKIRHFIWLIKWFKFRFCYNKWPNPSNSQNYCGVCCASMFACPSHIHPSDHKHASRPLHNYCLLCLTTSFCSVPEHCRERERERGDGSAICPVSVGIVIKRA